ncbi:hypothetical protein [Oceanobacillus luteolus]|uniref:DUF402 domain-containing protein n=1 Tax=Oceanobacillus luteolus TaxID=1274358 RepID=A0ABW4HYC7_9BACI
MNIFAEEDRMYKITVFANIEPTVLAKNLSSIRFKVNHKNGGMYWKGEDGFFNIIPFHNQSIQLAKGYRIYTNYPISTIVYLLDGAFNWLDSKITGIEYQYLLSKPKLVLIKEFLANPKLKVIDSRGLFSFDDMGIVIMEDKVVFQRRTKIKKIGEELRKIEDVRDRLFPSTYDLFSVFEGENAV